MKKGEINTFAVIVIVIAIVLVTAIVIAIISGNKKQPEGVLSIRTFIEKYSFGFTV